MDKIFITTFVCLAIIVFFAYTEILSEDNQDGE